MNPLCTCNFCLGIYVDTNPQTGARLFKNTSKYLSLENHDCPLCKTDSGLMDISSRKDLNKRLAMLSRKNIIIELEVLKPDYSDPEEAESLRSKTQPELIDLLITAAKYWREQAEN